MRPPYSLPPSLLFFAILCLDPPALISSSSQWWSFRSHLFALGMLVNNTVDDTSSQITYAPATSWHPSNVPCDGCLNPSLGLSYNQTWHDGTHIIPTADADDFSNSAQDADDTKSNALPAKTSSSPTANHNDGDADKGKGKDKGGDDDDKGGGIHRREAPTEPPARLRREDPDDNPFFVPKLDSDDQGFVDQPVFAQFNFTGSAVYVYALVPLFAAPANNTPTFVNLTFILNSQPDGSYSHTGTEPAPVNSAAALPTAYQPGVLVYTRSGLPEASYSLRMDVGPDSVFLLDYITYSQDDAFANGGNNTQNGVSTTFSGASPTDSDTPSSTIGQASTSSTNMPASSKSHNVATFAGAIGGSVGLLAILSLSLAFSIYRRRMLAKRRDRRRREAGGHAQSFTDSFHTDASEDGPPMQGPAPFVPRYFPGTVPTAPPPYLPPVSPDSAEVTTPLLASVSPVHTPLASTSWNTNRSGDQSYADRPPPTPPPEVEEDGYMAPPPSFGIAIASPVPSIFAQLSNVPAALASHSAAFLAAQTQTLAQPSRRPSRTSLAELGMNHEIPDFEISHPLPPSGSSRPVSLRASQSSLRQGQSSSAGHTTAAAEAPAGSSSSTERESASISNRPPSSASEIPPSIPPPMEIIEAEQERERQRQRSIGQGNEESSSR